MWNIFEFDMNLFIQMIGTAMGTIAAPTFVNLFMGKIDKMIKQCAYRGIINLIYFYKRFIDVLCTYRSSYCLIILFCYDNNVMKLKCNLCHFSNLYKLCWVCWFENKSSLNLILSTLLAKCCVLLRDPVQILPIF